MHRLSTESGSRADRKSYSEHHGFAGRHDVCPCRRRRQDTPRLEVGVASPLINREPPSCSQNKEAFRFMRRTRQTTVTVGDMNQTLCVPALISLLPQPSHVRMFNTAPSKLNFTGTPCFVEIVFNRDVGEGDAPKPVSWTAHWLIVEGYPTTSFRNRHTIANDTEESSIHQPSTSVLATQPLRNVTRKITGSVRCCCLQPPRNKPRIRQRPRVRHGAGLHAIFPSSARWVADSTPRTGAQTGAYGRVPEVVLAVTDAPLDIHFLSC